MVSDLIWMQRALTEAERGVGRVSPNPPVGAVLVRKNRLLSTGAHLAYGGPHAEVHALSAVPDRLANGATLYVTLEPCCHTGKTPPCTDLIIRKKIKRVVVALKDPNPLVGGRGLAQLSAAGVEVSCGLLHEKAVDLLQGYLKNTFYQKSYLFLKAAVTVDGRLATANGCSRWISNEACRRQVDGFRSRFAGVLCGANTLRLDNPGLLIRTPKYDNGHVPLRFFVIRRLEGIDEGFKAVRQAGIDGKTIFLVPKSKEGTPLQRQLEDRGVRFGYFNGNRLSFDTLLRLSASFGADSLLLEGGSSLISQAISEAEVDAGEIFISPLIIGDPKAPSLCRSLSPKSLREAYSLTAVHPKQYGNQFSFQFTQKKYGGDGHVYRADSGDGAGKIGASAYPVDAAGN